MNKCYKIELDTLNLLENSHLLLDANVLFDAFLFNEEFVTLLEKLKDINCTLYATKLIRLEFVGGTKDSEALQKRLKLLEIAGLIDLPEEREFIAQDNKQLLLNFSRQANKFSAVDYNLAWFLKKYKDSGLMLMTRNHSDFTGKLFERKGYIALFGDSEIRTYGIVNIKN